MPPEENLNIVTEVGVFGELNIDDPTIKKVNKKNITEEELNTLIQESIEQNAQI